MTCKFKSCDFVMRFRKIEKVSLYREKMKQMFSENQIREIEVVKFNDFLVFDVSVF